MPIVLNLLRLSKLTLRKFLFISLPLLLLTGCTARINENRVAFDGVMFNTKLKVASDKKGFEITVPRAHRSLNGAKEAGRYEATIYCVNKFGTSDITWVSSPDDVSEISSSNSIYLKGRCRI
jgi:hypothetical protein